jgi:hypothetical protein
VGGREGWEFIKVGRGFLNAYYIVDGGICVIKEGDKYVV